MIRAVLFDLDNTLIDRDAAIAAWLGELTSDERRSDLLWLDAGGYGDRGQFFIEVARCAKQSVAAVRQHFRQHFAAHARLARGADALLQRLQGSYRLAIGTNGSVAMQQAKMAAAGLHLPAIISESLGVRKPSVQFYTAALSVLGVRADEALMVGDHPINDIRGAKDSGLSTCWVRTRHHAQPAEADVVVDALGDVCIP